MYLAWVIPCMHLILLGESSSTTLELSGLHTLDTTSLLAPKDEGPKHTRLPRMMISSWYRSAARY